MSEPGVEVITEADLDALWADLDARTTPAQRTAFAAWEASLDRSVTALCAWGNCAQQVDPVTNQIVSGAGPVACPHDHLPGWQAKHPEGQSKPRVPAKAVGRHGSRVHRSAHRFRLPSYPNEWLPATTRSPSATS